MSHLRKLYLLNRMALIKWEEDNPYQELAEDYENIEEECVDFNDIEELLDYMV